MKNYGELLKNERLNRKISQEKLAKAIGITQAQISYYESNTNEPSISVCEKIADFYGTTIDTLISEPKEVKPKRLLNLGKKRCIIALCSAGLVWLVATVFFTFANLIFPTITKTWLAFIFAIPITLIVLLVLTSVWGKTLFNSICTSLLIWTLLLVIFLTLLNTLYNPPHTLWMIFLITQESRNFSASSFKKSLISVP